ncbi:MAG: hypothetical protein WCI81_00505, partial [Chlorobiaceae bacterium]
PDDFGNIMNPRLVFQDCRIEHFKALFNRMKRNFDNIEKESKSGKFCGASFICMCRMNEYGKGYLLK